MVLVTGGTGLVGAHLLLKLLQEGESIRATYRSIDSLQKTKNLFEIYNTQDLYEKIEWVEADILDIPALEIAFEQVEIVYHAAALISFDPKDEEKLRKTNIEGTANIVNLALDFGVKKLCFFSSIAAMGTPLASQNAVDETTEWVSEQPH
jgi:nucleoside-diphosphate-sugar epimerase